MARKMGTQSSRPFGLFLWPIYRSGSERPKTIHRPLLLRFFQSITTKATTPRHALLQRLLTQLSTCGMTSPTTRYSWQTQLTRKPCVGLCPWPLRLVTGTCPILTQRGTGTKSGMTMASGPRMPSGPPYRCPLGNDRRTWMFHRSAIPGAHNIGRTGPYPSGTRQPPLLPQEELIGRLQVCAVAEAQAPQQHQALFYKWDRHLAH